MNPWESTYLRLWISGSFLCLYMMSFFVPFSKSAIELAQLQKSELISLLPQEASPKEKELFWNHYEMAASHWLYRFIPRSRNQLSWYHLGPFSLWVLFGNDDDGVFGEGPQALWMLHKPPTFSKALLWSLRNPFHNYTFYVLGFASKYVHCDEFVVINLTPKSFRFCTYTPYGTTVFSDRHTCFFVAFHSMRPFISFRYTFENQKRFEGFCGWRERGNFGLKLALRSGNNTMYENLKESSSLSSNDNSYLKIEEAKRTCR